MIPGMGSNLGPRALAARRISARSLEAEQKVNHARPQVVRCSHGIDYDPWDNVLPPRLLRFIKCMVREEEYR